MKLLIVSRTLKRGGGISEWILNFYGELSKKKDVSIDLLIEERDENFYNIQLPDRIHVVEIHSLKKNFFKYLLDWYKISKNVEQKYNYVHIHTDNFVRFFNLPFLMKKHNVIIHSHNSYNDEVTKSKIKQLFHRIGKRIVKDGDFIRFACSDLAAKWLFGNKAYTQVNNAIDLKNFKFDEKSRNYYKNLLNLQDVTIYGHVGRFVYQKNHDKLIKIFSKIHLKNPKTKLLLVGDGPLIQTVKQQVKELSLDKDVLFLGHRDDVDKLLNMMDYIIFPSRYEGLPISLVEAQANGVPVFYSDSITSEIKLLNTSMAFSITDNSDDIANKILKTNATENRAAATETLRDEGYEKQDVVEQLYNFYQERQ